jgi:VIT1/CCC1 family predicted Fe2+/Mn2+ transporter
MVGGLIALIIYIIVVGLVLWLLSYIIDIVPMQPPFKQMAKTVLLVVGVLIIILILLSFIGVIDGGLPRLR